MHSTTYEIMSAWDPDETKTCISSESHCHDAAMYTQSRRQPHPPLITLLRCAALNEWTMCR